MFKYKKESRIVGKYAINDRGKEYAEFSIAQHSLSKIILLTLL
ncbi:hypothetical protein [Campylobacter sp. 2018MI34]|nr:hypothetical protein [Campylobacter sp. 2018MI34]